MQLDISRAMSICLRHGLKVYPTVSGKKFKVEVDDNGDITRYNKELLGKELNNALSKTYKYHAKLIMLSDASKS